MPWGSHDPSRRVMLLFNRSPAFSFYLPSLRCFYFCFLRLLMKRASSHAHATGLVLLLHCFRRSVKSDIPLFCFFFESFTLQGVPVLIALPPVQQDLCSALDFELHQSTYDRMLRLNFLIFLQLRYF